MVTIPAPWSICQWLKVRWHHSPRRPPCLRKSVRRIAISRSKGVLRGRGKARSVVPPWSESIAKLVPKKNNFNFTIWFVLAIYGDISIVFMWFNRPIYNARWFLLVIYRTSIHVFLLTNKHTSRLGGHHLVGKCQPQNKSWVIQYGAPK